MRIAYCEDEISQAILIKESITAWCHKNGEVCDMDLFSNGEGFLFELDGADCIPYDLLILDIAMGGMSGYELAKQIREKDTRVKIVFITSDPDHVFSAYELSAWRYLVKPVTQEKIAEMLSSVKREAEAKASYILMEIGQAMTRIDLEDILYLEVNGHYTTMYLKNTSYEMKESFQNMLQKLNETEQLFLECHRGIAVHGNRIKRITRQQCDLVGNITLPVSRGMYQSLNEGFIRLNLKNYGGK